MTERERFLLCLIYLLQRESEALRSVLSEFPGDKSEFVQMNRAELFRETIESMEYKL